MENTENKSIILDDNQVKNIEEGKSFDEASTEEEVVLPSEEADYQIPEKYKGKSAEELYKLMKKEEEYKLSQKDKGGDSVSTEGSEEGGEVVETRISQNEISDIMKEVSQNDGVISEDIYKKLEEKGISKEEADTFYEGVQAKAEKEISKMFEEAGVTVEQIQEAGKLARENWSEDRIIEFNTALDEAHASGNKTIQKALYRSLVDSVKGLPSENANKIHSNQPTSTPKVEGYSTKSDYFADVNNPRYTKDSSYRKLVETKFLKTDRSNW